MNKNQCIRVSEVTEEIMKFFEENKLLIFMQILIIPNKLFTTITDTIFSNSKHCRKSIKKTHFVGQPYNQHICDII